MLNSRLTEQLTDCGNLNIPTEARPIPVVVLGLGRKVNPAYETPLLRCDPLTPHKSYWGRLISAKPVWG